MKSRLNYMAVMMFCMVSCMMYPQTTRSAKHVLVDTDGGADDARACAVLLSSRDTEVMCITTSHGVLSAPATAGKVRVMLGDLHHEGIPVAVCRDTTFTPSHINSVCESSYWGAGCDTCGTHDVSPCDMMAHCIIHCPERCTVVACGPLTNVAELIKKHPHAAARIKEIIWSNEGMGQGYNYLSDTVSAHIVEDSGIPLHMVCDAGRGIREKKLLRMCKGVDNPYSRIICGNILSVYPHTPPLADLCAVLYLYHPQMFSPVHTDGGHLHTLGSDVSSSEICLALRSILRGDFYEECQMFDVFPEKEKYYKRDIKKISRDVIRRHGRQEWRAGVITGELHGHLGIYAIIGVKMGLRAREYMGVGIDDVKISSCTDSLPPKSCLNDGLQVSTGGTLGHGLISVSSCDDGRHVSGAVFEYGGKRVFVCLKPHIKDMMEKDIASSLLEHGMNTPAYWDGIRQLALRYWRDLDRYDIFDIKDMTTVDL